MYHLEDSGRGCQLGATGTILALGMILESLAPILFLIPRLCKSLIQKAHQVLLFPLRLSCLENLSPLHAHTHTHPTHMSLTWKMLLHRELYHTLNQVTSNIWRRHILYSFKYKSWRGSKWENNLNMWSCLLAFHSVSRGPRPHWGANGGGESPPFPHSLCAAQSWEAS